MEVSGNSATARQSANVEAVDQFRKGLALVEALSDMRERAERELGLQMGLGSALLATKSYSHPDIGRAHARAWEARRALEICSRTEHLSTAQRNGPRFA